MRSCAGELLGTLLLVAAVIGSGIMAERLSGGNAGVALLANTIATGAALFVLITIFAPISGAHFNPAVTLVLAVMREIAWPIGLLYIVAQCVGGALGAVLANVMFELDPVNLSQHVRAGPAQLISEIVATSALVLTILGTRDRPHLVAPSVALVIVAAYWFTASTSFANPAVTLGRTLSNTFAGIAPSSVVAFIGAQILGAGLTLPLCAWLFQPRRRPLTRR